MVLRSYRDQAMVLRSYKLGEADRIVVLLGRESGQIRAVAKGVRRTTSRFGARLDAFNLVDVQLHRGRNLDTVIQVELLTGYSSPLGADYDAFTAAKVMAETTQKLTEVITEPEPEYFRLLHGALAVLSKKTRPNALVLASFLLRIMAQAGWTPSLEECAVCGQTQDLRFFAADIGGMVCEDCASAGAQRLSVPGQDLLRALARGDWEATSVLPRSCWDEVGAAAANWTQWHLEQRLRSLPFLSVGN